MMIHMNKETSRIKSERASVPGILKMERQEKRQAKKNGSVTIEASFAIPLFLFAGTEYKDKYHSCFTECGEKRGGEYGFCSCS